MTEYTIHEASEILGITPRVLQRYARNAQRGEAGPKLYARKRGHDWVVSADAIERFKSEKRRNVLSGVDIAGIKAASADGESISAIARRYHVDKSYVSMIVRGKRNPRVAER